jgi:hypothetical protein
MSHFSKMGGVAALLAASTFVVGFVLLFTIMAPMATGDLDPIQQVAFLADNQAILYIWNLVIYVVFGVLLVVVALALNEQLKAGSPAIMQTATALGLIWSGLVIASGMVANIGTAGVVQLYDQDPALAATVWLSIDAVRNGLGGGNEIVGSLWVLLVSWAALRTGGLVRVLNYVGIVVGLAGIVTIIPPLEMVGAIFGMGIIVWFVWLSIVMLRRTPRAVARVPRASVSQQGETTSAS